MADETRPQSKAELMSEIKREWSALMDVVGRLTSEQMFIRDHGGWSSKDNLAHLTEWMNILVGFYFDHNPAHLVIGVDPQVTETWDYDVMNAIMFERDRDLPLEQVLAELNATYEKVITRLESMTFDDLMQPRERKNSQKYPIIDSVIGNTSGHFAEHRETIEKILKA
jgi:hypothetical protein